MLEYQIRNIKHLKDPATDRSELEGLPKWRSDRIMRMKVPLIRKQSIGSWRLLEEMFRKHHFSTDQIYIGKKGKLFSDNVFFSISHSGNTVMVALSDVPVGCDIEEVNQFPETIIQRVFSQSEKDYLQSVDPKNFNVELYRLWTGKESFLKMTGEGISDNLNEITVDLNNNYIYKRDFLSENSLLSRQENNYCFAICIGNNLRGINE